MSARITGRVRTLEHIAGIGPALGGRCPACAGPGPVVVRLEWEPAHAPLPVCRRCGRVHATVVSIGCGPDENAPVAGALVSR